MKELLFPALGALVVFFALVPLLTLASCGAAAWLPPQRAHGGLSTSAWRFLLVVGPSLGPVVWLVSAAIHQSEAGTALPACVLEHLDRALCRDVILFGSLLAAVVGGGVLWRARRRPDRVAHPLPIAVDPSAAAARVRSLCGQNLALRKSASRIAVIGRGSAPACTRGLWRPRVELEAALVQQLEDAELTAALLHELEHARTRDPLRSFVAHVALSLNPLRVLLAPELARYLFAREAQCDQRAVQRGADPLALARSIVAAATPAAPPRTVAALGGPGLLGVRVRVQLLLGYADRGAGPARRRAPVGLATALGLLVAAAPHVLGASPLDVLHEGVERAALRLAAE